MPAQTGTVRPRRRPETGGHREKVEVVQLPRSHHVAVDLDRRGRTSTDPLPHKCAARQRMRHR